MRQGLLPILVLYAVVSLPQRAATAAESDQSCCGYIVAGIVFHDQNSNTIKDGNEAPLAGWTVEVLTTAFVFVSSTTTNALGQFSFQNPVNCNTTFHLREVVPPGWSVTTPPNNLHTGGHTGCANQVFGGYDFGNVFFDCGDTTVTYTTDPQFNLGTLSGVVTNSNQLEIASTGTTFGFAWIANGDGTLSKVNTANGKEVARYYTGPPNNQNSYSPLQPSRTAVDDDGNCWVANRNSFGRASVTQVLANGGVDRNSNNAIETSQDTGNGIINPTLEMLPWGQDERVVRHYVVGANSTTDNYARALTLDKAGFLWVGLWTSGRVVKLDPNLSTVTYAPGQTPTAPPELASVSTLPGRPYGLALSPNGKLYGTTIGRYAFEIDPGIASGGTGAGPAMTQVKDLGLNAQNYGIAVDRSCIVWMAMLQPGSGYSPGCVRWDPTVGVGNQSLGWTYSTPGSVGQGRGITVDFNGKIWMATNDGSQNLAKYNNTPTPTFMGLFPSGVGAAVGVGAAEDGNIVAVGFGTNNWNKVNATTGAWVTTGGPQLTSWGPYSYSDFTGSLRNLVALQQGFWNVITDGGTNGIAWNLVSWNSFVPATTGLTVEARVAPTLVTLANLPWTLITTSGPLSSPIKGRYIETRVRLKRQVSCGSPFVTPILYDLTVSAICDTCFFVNCPADTVVPCESSLGAVVFYTPPFGAGACDNQIPITCNPPPGSVFPMGTTAVTCMGQSVSGDTVSCKFNVTVHKGCIPILTGACCTGGLCLDTSEEDCQNLGGIYFGDGSSCLAGTNCDEICIRPPQGLKAWWPMDGPPWGSTPNLCDFTANGTLMGPPTGISGQYVNASYDFDGAGEHIDVPTAASLAIGTSDLSIDAWIKTTDTDLSVIVDKRQAAPIQGYVMFLTGGYPGFQIASGGAWSNYVLSAGNGGAAAMVADNQWHLLAVTVDRDDPSGIQFYVDGSPVGTAMNPTAHQGSLSNSSNLLIAKGHPTLAAGSYLTGGLDELEIYARELAPSDIVLLYSAGTGGKCREACYATLLTACCTGGSGSASISICNYSTTSHLYSYGLTPLTGGSCMGVGVTSFTPSTGTVTVPAASCVTIPITAICPTDIPAGQVACYAVTVFNHDTGNLFGCKGSVRRPVSWCWDWQFPGGVAVLGLSEMSSQTIYQLELVVSDIATDPSPVPLSFTLRPTGPDGVTPSDAFGFDGLPPGEPYFGVLAVPPGGQVVIPVNVVYSDERAIGYDRIMVEADDTMDGVPEEVSSMGARSLAVGLTGVPPEPAPDPNLTSRAFLSLPNPFSKSARIEFRLDQPGRVSLGAFDVHGRIIRSLIYQTILEKGVHVVDWDGNDGYGRPLPAGVYYLKLETPAGVEKVKAVLVR